MPRTGGIKKDPKEASAVQRAKEFTDVVGTFVGQSIERRSLSTPAHILESMKPLNQFRCLNHQHHLDQQLARGLFRQDL